MLLLQHQHCYMLQFFYKCLIIINYTHVQVAIHLIPMTDIPQAGTYR